MIIVKNKIKNLPARLYAIEYFLYRSLVICARTKLAFYHNHFIMITEPDEAIDL